MNNNFTYEEYINTNRINNKTNEHFKNEYRKYFNLKKYACAPNLYEFIISPPDKNVDKEYYDFWTYYFKNNI